jgi:AcrR family transcriptional regulator
MAKAKRATPTTTGAAVGEDEDDAGRRREILDAAFAIFAEKGFGDATMLEIAQRASASKETLYAWFGNKERLFETLMVSRFYQIESGAAQEVAPDGADPHACLAFHVRRQLTITTRPDFVALLRILVSEAPRRPGLRRIIQDTLSRKELAKHLMEYRARGWIDFPGDPKDVAGIFARMIEGDWIGRLYYGLIDHVSERAIAAHADLVARIFLNGLAPAARTKTPRASSKRAALETRSTELRSQRRRAS